MPFISVPRALHVLYNLILTTIYKKAASTESKIRTPSRLSSHKSIQAVKSHLRIYFFKIHFY